MLNVQCYPFEEDYVLRVILMRFILLLTRMVLYTSGRPPLPQPSTPPFSPLAIEGGGQFFSYILWQFHEKF